MASLTSSTDGKRRIMFVAKDGSRKAIWLGDIPMKAAQSILVKVEALAAALMLNHPIDRETAAWVAGIGDDLAEKLAAAGLIPPRASSTLGPFLDDYLSTRTDIKPNTRRNLIACKDRLLDYFGNDKPLRDITQGDADRWLLWLKERYASATTGRTVKRAKQFFKAAVRSKLIPENPFHEVKPPSQTNERRKVFVPRDVFEKVIAACPDAEWRLILALSRYGGLRCPSETLELRLADVDWERGRFLVHSSKTEHHEDGGDRWVPLFEELRPHLEEVFDQAPPGTVYFINRYRKANSNLRTQLLRIIKRAGVTPWERLFHNLRASRETELALKYPLHIVCAWIGNTEKIAEKHYLTVPEIYFQVATGDADFDARLTQISTQQGAAPDCTTSPETTKALPKQGFLPNHATPFNSVQCTKVPPRGLEPLS
ncbi:MAG: tyrosine-type recombinase/integrase [Gemmataceae bacterium]